MASPLLSTAANHYLGPAGLTVSETGQDAQTKMELWSALPSNTGHKNELVQLGELH